LTSLTRIFFHFVAENILVRFDSRHLSQTQKHRKDEVFAVCVCGDGGFDLLDGGNRPQVSK